MLRTTILLLLCFILAQADKQVVGLLALQIQASFDLSNTELGLLQGGAFAVAFAIGGLPIAKAIDGGHRVRLAALCVLLWSAATMLCGLATSFLMLLLFRAATAVAEAGLPPAAFSIFSQQPDRRLLARMTGLFMLAPFIGTGLMFAGGGWLVSVLGRGGSEAWEPWRIVLMTVGALGFLLGPLLAMFGREPERARPARGEARGESYRTIFAHIFVERPFLRFYYLGLPAVYLATASLLAWYPALLVKRYGASVGEAGVKAGLTYLVCGVAGTIAATALASSRKDLMPAAIARGFLLAAVALAPVLAITPLAPSLAMSLIGYGVFAFLSAGILAMMPVPIQLALGERMRARGTAIISLLMSAVAGTIGPLSVGMIVDLSGASLATALSATLGASSLLAILCLAGAVASGRIREPHPLGEAAWQD